MFSEYKPLGSEVPSTKMLHISTEAKHIRNFYSEWTEMPNKCHFLDNESQQKGTKRSVREIKFYNKIK